MKKLLQLILPLALVFYSCNTNNSEDEDSIEKWKSEIMATEIEFAAMVENEGLEKAFLTYAADDAVLKRNNTLIIGKEALRESYENNDSEIDKVTLTWKPDFVDVSLSGDLGYTYGKYVYTITDSLGNSNAVDGFFHTVWKRQAEGKWKFVWD